jgi:hypothetical protein
MIWFNDVQARSANLFCNVNFLCNVICRGEASVCQTVPQNPATSAPVTRIQHEGLSWVVVIRCPRTGQEISTGIDGVPFRRAPVFLHARIARSVAPNTNGSPGCLGVREPVSARTAARALADSWTATGTIRAIREWQGTSGRQDKRCATGSGAPGGFCRGEGDAARRRRDRRVRPRLARKRDRCRFVPADAQDL